jgi:predicted PurR-regulated permease PerM
VEHDRQFNRRLLTVLVGLFIVGVLFYALLPVFFDLLGIGVTLLVAAIGVLLLNPIADRLEARRIPRAVTVISIYALLAILIGVLVVMMVRPLTAQLDYLNSSSTDVVTSVDTGLKGIFGPTATIESVGVDTAQVSGGLRLSSQAMRSAIGQLGELLVNLMLVGVLILFLVTDRSLSQGLLRLAPVQYQATIARTTVAISGGLTRWLIAQSVMSLYYAATYILVNVMLGIPFGVTIGIVSGLLEFIPYLGNIVGLILTLMAALTVSPQTAIWAVIWGAFFGIIGGNLIGPYVLGKAARVHPALIIIALLLGGVFGGVLGLLLAMPVLVIVTIVVQELRASGFFGAARAAGEAAVASLRQPLPPSDPDDRP